MMNVSFKCKKTALPLMLKTFILFVFIFVSYLFVNRMIRKDVYICHEDEMIYFNAAKLFYETNSLKAGFCINENRSIIGEYNWYGPGYALIYGGIAKIFVAINYALFILCLFLIWKLPFTKIKRLLFLAIFLSTYASFSFVFTFFPEELNLLFALLLLVLFARIKCNKSLLIPYIILIFVFSLVRVSFIFWIFTLFFIKNSPIKRVYTTIIAFVLFIVILVYMKLFNAPAFVQGLKEIYGTGKVPNVFSFIIHIVKNAMWNCKELYQHATPSVFCIIYLLFLAIVSVISIKQKDNSNFGIILLLLIVSLVFLSLYIFLPIYIEKQLLFFVPLCIYLIIQNKKYISILLFFSFFLFVPYTMLKTKEFVDQSKQFFYNYQNESHDRELCNSIFKDIAIQKKEINVLFQYRDFNFTYLPVSINGVPILYTTNVLAFNYSDSLRYKRFNKIKIDFILAKHPIILSSYRLVKNAGYYFLYQKK
jgi:hypothetical protein